jgi:hypothetical protein
MTFPPLRNLLDQLLQLRDPIGLHLLIDRGTEPPPDDPDPFETSIRALDRRWWR